MIASSKSPCAVMVALVVLSGVVRAQDTTVRSTAVVDLSFDEMDGPAEDRATAGAAKDAAQPMNAPARVTSPFWNVRGGRAVRFDAAATQFFQIADSPDVDHAAGTTLSFFYLNLHELSDATFRGIVAKRNAADQKTNYGLNYQPSSRKLQVYVNDGSGYKTMNFPIPRAIGVRRLGHLSATFGPGDAPEPDADADADDLQIRLYINGKPLKPRDSVGGTVTEDGGWITDLNLAGLLSDAPLTIGASFPNGEPVSAVLDEFLAFNRPLTPEEAAKLFVEVAGPDAERLAKLESAAAPSSVPAVTDITPRGLQVGATTRLVITGQNLAPSATLSFLGASATATVLPESTPERLVADIAVPAEAVPALVPFAVRTTSGISTPVPLSIDRLTQRAMSDAAAGEPVTLPAAFTGTLSGTEQPRIVFEGRKGDPFVAEVELKRLGGGADPVLELKMASGTPVGIAWGRTQRGGDPQLVTTLPADGRYILELHDLAYQAPSSTFRLLVGNLRLFDMAVPPATAAGQSRQGIAAGVGVDGMPVELISATGEPTVLLGGPAAGAAHGVLPSLPVSDGREFSESEAAAEPVDIAGGGLAPTYVTGQLAASGEVDRFVLRVQPGQALDLRVESKTVGSPVEPILTVLEQGKPIARQAAQPGASTVTVNVTPQAPEGQIEVQVADRLRGFGSEQLYRLRIAPAGSAECQVVGLDPAVTLPASGRGVTRFRIERAGSAGAVTLIPDEASGIVVEPAVLPAGAPSEEVFVTLAAAPGRQPGESLAMTAEVETPNGPIRRPVRFSPGPAVERFAPNRAYFRVPIVTSTSAPSLELAMAPSVAFKGLTEGVGLKVSGEVPEGYSVRFSLVSDEPARPNDPAKPEAGNKPRVRLAEDAAVPAGIADAAIPLLVPGDVAAAEIRAVVKAEVVPHIYSDRVAAVGYSAPLRLAVKDPITALEPAGPAALKAGENRQVKVVVRRQEGFARPVRVELRGLPQGFAAPPIDLPADQAEATFTVSVPAGTAAGPVSNVELAVTGQGGAVLKSLTPFAIEVAP
jgi:hypothetical protein